jgi:predicted amidohydrolase
MDQITKIGFYSPEGPEKPLERFITALTCKSQAELYGSLIVLPEAFNIGVPYGRSQSADTNPNVLNQLRRVCKKFDVCFVAGLIISTPSDVTFQYKHNSAYLIDANGFGLLCHKKNFDNQGPYSTCLDGCDGHNAIQYRNVAVASLICMDAYAEHYNDERHKELTNKLDLTQAAIRLVCIPAYIDNGSAKKFVSTPRTYRILANSANRTAFPSALDSFVEHVDEDGNVTPLLGLEDNDPLGCVKLYPLKLV